MNINNQSLHSTKSFSAFLFGLSANELVTLGYAIGILIGQGLTIDEQDSLGNFLDYVGELLLTMNSQNALIQGRLNRQNNFNNFNGF